MQVESLWATCSADLIQSKEDDGDLGLCFTQESFSSCTNEISSQIRSMAPEDIKKLVNACHPQLKQIFIHCLNKNNLPLHGVPGDKDFDSKAWQAACIKTHISRSNAPRRNLGHELPQRILKSKDKKGDKKKKKKGDDNMVIIAAAAAATSVICVVVLLCLCCCCCRETQVRKTDERPLLSLSRSDNSFGTHISFFSLYPTENFIILL